MATTPPKSLEQYQRLTAIWTGVAWLALITLLVALVLSEVWSAPKHQYGPYQTTPGVVATIVVMCVCFPVSVTAFVVASNYRGWHKAFERAAAGNAAPPKVLATSARSGRGSMSRMEFRAFERRVTGYRLGRNRGPRAF